MVLEKSKLLRFQMIPRLDHLERTKNMGVIAIFVIVKFSSFLAGLLDTQLSVFNQI